MKNRINTQCKAIKIIIIMMFCTFGYSQYRQINKEPKGPDFSQTVLFPTLGEGALNLIKENFNIHSKIYKDKNSYSNIYYYLPKGYTLKWNKEVNEYDFNIHYLSSGDSKRQDVLISMALTSNINEEDMSHAEKLISQKIKKPIKLRALETYGAPNFDFQQNLKLLNVHVDSVRVSAPSDMTLPLTTSWKMNTHDVNNFISSMLENINIGGNITFKLDEEGEHTVRIPVNLKVNDSKTFGKMEFASSEQFLSGWKNNFDYPIIPKRITLLSKGRMGRNPKTRRMVRISPDKIIDVNLNTEALAPNDTFSLTDQAAINRLSKINKIYAIWVDYDIKECDECNKIVKRKLIGGTSGSEISNMEVQVLNALEFSEANAIQVLIKSIQVDPNGVDEIELPPIQIVEDGQTISDIQLFVPQGENLAYEYQVKLIMASGKIHKSSWKKGTSNLLVLAEKQIKRLFPNKTKDEILENAKNGAITKLKDTLLGKDVTEEELVSKGIDILSGLFKKKDSKKNDEKEKGDDQTEHNEDLEDDHADKNSDTSENLEDVEDENDAKEEKDTDDTIEDPNSNEDNQKEILGIDNSEGDTDTNTEEEEEKKDEAKEAKDQDTKTGNKKKKD